MNDEIFRPTVVLIDDDPRVLTSLARLLAPFPLGLHAFTDPEEALACIDTRVVNVVLCDCRMPLMSGTEVLERAALLQPHAARILLSGYSSAQMGVDAINRGSVARFLAKPWDDAKIWTTIRELAAGSVLNRFLSALAPFLARLLDLPTPPDMLGALKGFLWRELSLDVMEGGGHARESVLVWARLGARELAVTLSPAHREIFQESSRKRLLGMIEIAVRATLQAAAERDQAAELEQRAEIDALSGALNRRGFDSTLAREINRAGRYKAPLSIVFLDIDRFKDFNDSFGHGVADVVITRLGKLLCSMTRAADSVARYGGDEFCLILPGVDAAGAVETALRVRSGSAGIDVARGVARVTLSIGVAEWQEGVDAQKLVERADRAAYHVKQTGRDGVALLTASGAVRIPASPD